MEVSSIYSYLNIATLLTGVVMRQDFTGVDNGCQRAPVLPLSHRIINNNVPFSNLSSLQNFLILILIQILQSNVG